MIQKKSPAGTGLSHAHHTSRPEEIDARILAREETERKEHQAAVSRAAALGYDLRDTRSGLVLRAGSRTLHVGSVHALTEVLEVPAEVRAQVVTLRHKVAFAGTGMHLCAACNILRPHGPGWYVALFEPLPSEANAGRTATAFAVCPTCAEDPGARARARGHVAMRAGAEVPR